MASLEKFTIAAIVNQLFQKDEYLVSHLLSDNYIKYSLNDINCLISPKAVKDYIDIANFSNSIYEMPDSIDFKRKEIYLWQQLYLLFNFKNVIFAKENNSKKNIENLLSKIKTDIGELSFVNFFNKEDFSLPALSLEKNVEKKFKDNFTDQDIDSSESNKSFEIETKSIAYLKNISTNILNEEEYAYSAIWEFWKNMFLINYAVYDLKSPYSYSGYYYTNYSLLLDDNKWETKKIHFNEMQTVLETPPFIDKAQQIKDKLKKFDEVSFKIQKLNIEQTQWFNPIMFKSQFWDIKNESISDGKLKGSIPSYIDEVIFVKEFKSSIKENLLKKSLKWVGEFFFGKIKEDYPKYFNELPEDDKGNIYLAAYLCKIVPKCPNPDPNLDFS
jgi:hypothetical protein